MRVVVFGAGNLLLSDEGFGVHLVRHLERAFRLPDEVELFDAGTLGIMATHELEAADCVILVDALDAAGAPGEVREYSKADILLDRIPAKLSPHQIGVQEMLLVSEMRGRCPEEVLFIGVIPGSLDPGTELSPACAGALDEVAQRIVGRLRERTRLPPNPNLKKGKP